MGSQKTDLEWKEFFGSSVSLAPSLISIYDKKIAEDGINMTPGTVSASERSDSAKRPPSLRSNNFNCSNVLKSQKKKIAPSGRCPVFQGFCATVGDFSLTLDGRFQLDDSGNKKFENRRSKSVENGMALKKGDSFNSHLVCREIIETERIYVRDLKETIKGYLRIMESRPDLFKKEDVRVLFGNVEDICSFHCELLKGLIVHEKEVDLLSDCFISNASGFKMYSQYCTNYPRSQKVFMELMADEETGCWMQEQQTILNHKLPLSSYLLKPVQRILKYHLLFQNLLKSFEVRNESASCEFVKASAALNCMSSVARYINEMKRVHDKNLKMREILDLLVSCNPFIHLEGLGNLIIEDKFQFGLKTLQHVMLFERHILICKYKDNNILAVKVQIPCSNLMLVETISKSPLSFSIHPFTDPSLLLTIQAKSLEQKSVWCHEIRKVILGNFDAHVPEKARHIVLNLTPKVPGADQIDDKAFGQIEWRKSSRRCSMAIIPDIRPSSKPLEKCNSTENYARLEDKQKHLPLSRSLYSVNDGPDAMPFMTGSSTLPTDADQKDWFYAGHNASAFHDFSTLGRSCISASKSSCDDRSNFCARKRKESANSTIFKINSSSHGNDRKESQSEGSGEMPQRSSSVDEEMMPWLNASISKGTGSFHNSLFYSSKSSSSFRSTFLNLKDKFKRRSHSTDNRHHQSAQRLQGPLEDVGHAVRRGPSYRLVSRFGITSRKSKTGLDKTEHSASSEENSQTAEQFDLGMKFRNGPRVTPDLMCQKKACIASNTANRCFSPPGASKILFIDDSDDG